MGLTGLHVISDVIEELGYKRVIDLDPIYRIGAGQYKIYDRYAKYIKYCPNVINNHKKFVYIGVKGQMLHVHGAGICIFINLVCPDSLDQLRQAIRTSEEFVGNSISPREGDCSSH